MDHQFFVIVLVFLAVLAVVDLFVGVSNDAVNFLNSAVGSRIAPFKTVLLVASLGVLTGATFSSGMMDIARNGVFNPQMFTFNEIMTIFFAVMIADVLLLNVFNSLGLPTSTTVSIVFDLMGGAVAAAAWKIWREGGSFLTVGGYINNEKFLAITSGILISVVVAFAAGVLTQYLARLIFTFQYQKMYRRLGGLFGGLALTAIFYFLMMKGARGASFMRPEYLAWLEARLVPILLGGFIGLSALFQGLILARGVNIFKAVILAGTFALAFAFAGNDLVNFVGVPLTAFESYGQYLASGLGPETLTMESLQQAVHTPTAYLLLSGLVMVATLWTSRKAHNVLQTSLSLSRGNRGEEERFGSSLIGRLVVRSGLSFGQALRQALPSAVVQVLGRRLEKPPLSSAAAAPPFDHLRASVNLVVASILIASATSLKLPLSTTYVTFMVAMGSSFADGDWDRESAVYRVSGVLMVIGGWFVTAFSAFTTCAAVTLLVFAGGSAMTVILAVATVILFIRSNFFSRRRAEGGAAFSANRPAGREDLRESLNRAVARNLNSSIEIFRNGLAAFLNEDEPSLKQVRNEAVGLFDDLARRRGEYYRMALTHGDRDDDNARHFHYRAFTNMKDVGHSLREVLGQAQEHIANRHRVYAGPLRDNLGGMVEVMKDMGRAMYEYSRAASPMDEETFNGHSIEAMRRLNQLQLELLRRIDAERLSMRGSELYLSFLQFAREFINRYGLVAFLQRELNEAAGR